MWQRRTGWNQVGPSQVGTLAVASASEWWEGVGEVAGISLGLLAYLRFEDGWGGCHGGLTTEPEDMVGALGHRPRRSQSFQCPEQLDGGLETASNGRTCAKELAPPVPNNLS